ncbi:MAG: hypothetical protein AB8B53_08510 [Flavobacteriales bacterium]
MKLAITLVTFIVSLNLFGQQNPDCSEVKTGTFILYDDAVGATIIKRKKKFQTEKNDKLGVKVKYELVWLDDCTYELRGIRSYKGPEEYRGLDTDILTTEILWIRDGQMRVRSSSNFSEMVVEVEMDIL